MPENANIEKLTIDVLKEQLKCWKIKTEAAEAESDYWTLMARKAGLRYDQNGRKSVITDIDVNEIQPGPDQD